MKKHIVFILVIALFSSINSFGQAEPDMDYSNVKFRMGLFKGLLGWPKGEGKLLKAEDGYIEEDKDHLIISHAAEFKDLFNLAGRLNNGCFVVLFEYKIGSVKPQAGKVKGTVSYYKKAEEDENASGEPFNDDGENEKGWEDPSPKNIPEDLLPPELEEESEYSEYSEDMSDYAKEGEDAELIVLDGEVGFLSQRRMIIVNNLKFPKWNQISLSYGNHILELHFTLHR